MHFSHRAHADFFFHSSRRFVAELRVLSEISGTTLASRLSASKGTSNKMAMRSLKWTRSARCIRLLSINMSKRDRASPISINRTSSIAIKSIRRKRKASTPIGFAMCDEKVSDCAGIGWLRWDAGSGEISWREKHPKKCYAYVWSFEQLKKWFWYGSQRSPSTLTPWDIGRSRKTTTRTPVVRNEQ